MSTTEQGADARANVWEIATNALLGALFALLTYRSFLAWYEGGNFQALILTIQEAIIVGLLITRRRSREASTSWYDRLIAIAGTAAPLLQVPLSVQDMTLELIGTVFQTISLTLSVVATISLGRSFGIVAANRGVQTGGLYRLVRHPLYGSYMVGYIGFLIGNLSILNVALIAITVLCQYLRAVAEERILMRDPDYQAYMQRVRARFIPFIF